MCPQERIERRITVGSFLSCAEENPFALNARRNEAFVAIANRKTSSRVRERRGYKRIDWVDENRFTDEALESDVAAALENIFPGTALSLVSP